MTAHANDRAPADIDPSSESWLYRSEAFAEDLDEPMSTVVPPSAAAVPARRIATRPGPWSAALSGLWQSRAQAAR